MLEEKPQKAASLGARAKTVFLTPSVGAAVTTFRLILASRGRTRESQVLGDVIYVASHRKAILLAPIAKAEDIETILRDVQDNVPHQKLTEDTRAVSDPDSPNDMGEAFHPVAGMSTKDFMDKYGLDESGLKVWAGRHGEDMAKLHGREVFSHDSWRPLIPSNSEEQKVPDENAGLMKTGSARVKEELKKARSGTQSGSSGGFLVDPKDPQNIIPIYCREGESSEKAKSRVMHNHPSFVFYAAKDEIPKGGN